MRIRPQWVKDEWFSGSILKMYIHFLLWSINIGKKLKHTDLLTFIQGYYKVISTKYVSRCYGYIMLTSSSLAEKVVVKLTISGTAVGEGYVSVKVLPFHWSVCIYMYRHVYLYTYILICMCVCRCLCECVYTWILHTLSMYLHSCIMYYIT